MNHTRAFTPAPPSEPERSQGQAKGTAALGLVLGVFLLTGCFTSRSLGTLRQEGASRAAQLGAIKLLETTAPEHAAEQYRAFLAQEAKFDKPLLYYQKQFQMQLLQMRSSRSVQVLGDDVLAAFPLFFHRRLTAQVRAYLGLSRLQLAAGKPLLAEKAVQDTIQLINSRSRSFLFSGRELRTAYSQLQGIYSRTGEPGKALAARLNTNLLGDFMVSPFAVVALAEEGETEARIDERMVEIDKFIAKVNRHRSAKAAAELASALSDIVGGFDVGGMAVDISMAAAEGITSSMEIVTSAILLAAQDPDAGPESAATPMANPILAGQLLDPRMGKDPGSLINRFAKEAVRLDSSEGIRQAAGKVFARLHDLKRTPADPKALERLAAVKALAEALYALEARVQAVKNDRGG